MLDDALECMRQSAVRLARLIVGSVVLHCGGTSVNVATAVGGTLDTNKYYKAKVDGDHVTISGSKKVDFKTKRITDSAIKQSKLATSNIIWL